MAEVVELLRKDPLDLPDHQERMVLPVLTEHPGRRELMDHLDQMPLIVLVRHGP